MARPQKENGYTPIANEIVEALCKARLSGREWRILMTLLRKTYGWRKKQDRITLKQFSEATGIDREKCHTVLKRLAERQIVERYRRKNNKKKVSYRFQKDHERWVLPKMATRTSRKRQQGVAKNGNKVLPKMATANAGKDSDTKASETVKKLSKRNLLKETRLFFSGLLRGENREPKERRKRGLTRRRS